MAPQRNNMISPNRTDETIDDVENISGDQKSYKSHQQRTPIAGLVEVSTFQSLKPSPSSNSYNNSSSEEEGGEFPFITISERKNQFFFHTLSVKKVGKK